MTLSQVTKPLRRKEVRSKKTRKKSKSFKTLGLVTEKNLKSSSVE